MDIQKDEAFELAFSKTNFYKGMVESLKNKDCPFESVFEIRNGKYRSSYVQLSHEIWQAAQAVPEGQAIVDVLAERKRQIEQEHYAIEHDDEYQSNELVRAAASYSEHVIARQWIYKDSDPEIYQSEEAPEIWPWAIEFWKPKSPRKDLVRAAALLLAEIERIDRTGPQEPT